MILDASKPAVRNNLFKQHNAVTAATAGSTPITTNTVPAVTVEPPAETAPPPVDDLDWHKAQPYETPCDQFDRIADWADILCPAGWRIELQVSDESRWTRPGKECGVSATTGHCNGQDGADLLRVFSSNAALFQADQAYGKSRTLAMLRFDGDMAKTASYLRANGYGWDVCSPEAQAEAEKIIGTLLKNAERHHSEDADDYEEKPANTYRWGDTVFTIDEDPDPVPDSLLDVPGFVNEFTDWTRVYPEG